MRAADLKQIAGHRRRRSSLAVITTGLAVSLAICGCGNTYRPVVSAINPVGPAGQPQKFAVAVSNPSTAPTTATGGGTVAGTALPGLLTFVDVSGDTILSTPSILSFPSPTSPGTATTPPTPTLINPNNFALNLAGSEGFIVNSSGEFENFPTGNPQSLLTQNIVPISLAQGAEPNGIQSFQLPSTGTTIFVPETANGQIPELEIASGASLLQNLAVPSAVYVVGVDSAQRVYAISTNGSNNGTVYPIENSPVSIDSGNLLQVGVNPVYGVMTTDGNRAFILNKGDGTISVINVPSNGLDVTTPTIALPTLVRGVTSAPNPVWADLVTIESEFVVLNQGDGVNPGSLSIISVPLCNANTPVTNPNCNSANPLDAADFGTIVGTVPVGISPTMVSALADGTRAYVVNGSDPKCPSSLKNGTFEGSVSVVDLKETELSSTICGISTPSGTLQPSSSPTLVYGHPNTIAATTGTPTGKVYVTSSDNKYMTVIETDTDTVDTHISLQGLGIRVLVTAK